MIIVTPIFNVKANKQARHPNSDKCIYSIYKLKIKEQHNLHCCCHCSMFDFPRSLMYETEGKNLL